MQTKRAIGSVVLGAAAGVLIVMLTSGVWILPANSAQEGEKAGGTQRRNEVKVLFAESLRTESSKLYNFDDWYTDKKDKPTTMADLYKEGWRLVQMEKLSAVAAQAQFTLVFER